MIPRTTVKSDVALVDRGRAVAPEGLSWEVWSIVTGFGATKYPSSGRASEKQRQIDVFPPRPRQPRVIARRAMDAERCCL